MAMKAGFRFLLLMLAAASCRGQSGLVEPCYTSSLQQYCSVSFSPDSLHRMMIVIDSNDVYIDRNLNRDLRDPGEKLLLFDEKGRCSASVNDITFCPPGDTGRTSCAVYVGGAHERAYHILKGLGPYALKQEYLIIRCTLPDGRRFGGSYGSGPSVLPSAPAIAPDLKLFGPSRIELLYDDPSLNLERTLRYDSLKAAWLMDPHLLRCETRIMLTGQEKGNSVYQLYNTIPDTCFPTVNIRYIDQSGRTTGRGLVKLTERC
ncbi:hypothetical protein JXO52_12095 [bacterium]|nr:hypothetical protein [bacterium]